VLPDASPELVYDDTGGDGGVETDLWVDGTREEVADGAGAVGPFNLDPSDTAQVHIWGGGGTVAHVVASVFCDATPTPQTNAGWRSPHRRTSTLAQARPLPPPAPTAGSPGASRPTAGSPRGGVHNPYRLAARSQLGAGIPRNRL
jgi:hypothetical protein